MDTVGAMLMVFITLALGFCLGYLYRSRKPGDQPVQQTELAIVRHEIGVLVNVLEEAGIEFNRDYDRNVTGVVREVQVEMVGEGVTNGQR